MKIKSQSAIEFMVIIGFVLFFFIIFFSAVQENIRDKVIEKQDLIIKEIAITVQNEINLALESSEGYSRDFKIPEDLGNKDYEITIVEDMVYLKTDDEQSAIALPIADITGEIQKGMNTIKKQNGEVLLNP